MECHDSKWLINPLVNDFKIFTDYINREKPLLTEKKGVLGKKHSFKLNSMLHNKRIATILNSFTTCIFSGFPLMS